MPIESALTPRGFFVQPISTSNGDVFVRGAPVVGSTLTAVGNKSFTGIQWTSTTPAGVTTDISGATSSTYTLVAGDAGNTIGFRTTTPAYTAPGVPVTAALPAPSITTLPTIVSANPGEALVWNPGTGVGMVTYGIIRNGVRVGPLTSGQRFTAFQAGDQLRIGIRVSDGFGASVTDHSTTYVVVPAGSLPTINLPTIVGVASTYTPQTTPQQWTLDGANVATTDTYTQSLADSAKVLRVATAGGTSAGALPGMRNWKASNTVNLRAMLAGGIRGRQIFFGDSYIAGHGANGVANDGNRAKGWVTRMAAGLSAAGIPASASFAFGGSNSGTDSATLAAYDPRYAFSGTGTGLLANVDVPGGLAIGLTATGDKVTFTPGGTFDTVDLVYPRNTTGQGNFTVSVDGGTTTIQTVENSSVADVGYISITVPAGSTAVTVTKGTGFTYLTMMGTRTAAAPGVEVYCAGINGTQLQVMARAPQASGNRLWNARATLMKMCNNSAKNAVFINGWYNDLNAGSRTLQQVSDDLRTLLTEIKSYADVVYCGYAALGGTIGTGANFRTFQDELMRIAIEEFDLPVFDMSRVSTSQAANASYYYDTLHLGLTGHPLATAVAVSQQLLIRSLT